MFGLIFQRAFKLLCTTFVGFDLFRYSVEEQYIGPFGDRTYLLAIYVCPKSLAFHMRECFIQYQV